MSHPAWRNSSSSRATRVNIPGPGATLSGSGPRLAFKRVVYGALNAPRAGDTIKAWARRSPLGPAA